MLRPLRLFKMPMGRLWIGLVCLLLTACGGAVSIPELTYYRLPSLSAPDGSQAGRSGTLFPIPVVVDVFQADGLYAEQALIYALDDGGGSLRAYHYQLWNDPPVRLLQRRLLETLLQARAADVVVDRLGPNVDALHIFGLLQGFERIPVGAGWKVRAAIQMRVERGDLRSPLLLKSYATEVAATDATVNASVRAMAAAVDQLYVKFLEDLRSVKIPASIDGGSD